MKRKGIVFAVLILLLLLCACRTEAGREPGVPSDLSNDIPSASSAPMQEHTFEPVPEPTFVPEQTPVHIPMPESTPEPISPEEYAARLEAYFDGTVFIGDSIMEGIRQYVAQNRAQTPTLGDAQFLTSTIGVSVAKLLNGEQAGPYYRYNGQNQYLLQILPQLECRRIFVQLGLNDMSEAGAQVENSVQQYGQLIDLLQSTVPEAEIIVITNPPKVASMWLPDYTANRKFGNELISEFVGALIEMCEDRGIPYVDAHTALQNEEGVLPDDYCRDGFIHLNNAGAKVVVEELYRFAAERIG